MKVINLGDSNSVIGNIIAQMRDRNVQKDSLRFRSNLKKLGNIFAYELSKTLDYHPKDITTPLATARVNISDSKIVAATILRAGRCTRAYWRFSTRPRTLSSRHTGNTTKAMTSM